MIYPLLVSASAWSQTGVADRFSPTTINIAVCLTVFDALGREIATLVNEHLSAGTYQAAFDASNNASGVYYYKLKAGDYTETRSMVYLK